MKKEDVRFDSEFIEKGLWWLPENPKEYFGGILSYSLKEGIRLETWGYSNLSEKQSGTPEKIIHGQLTSGLEVSLFKCYSSFSFSVSSSQRVFCQKFHVSTAFFGQHLKDEESKLYFEKMNLQFNYLENWLNIDPFPYTYSNNHFQITYKPPVLSNESIYKVEQIKTTIKLNPKPQMTNKNLNHKTLIYKCSLDINPSKEQNLDWFLQVALDVENFFSLLSNSPIRYVHLSLYIDSETSTSILYQQINHSNYKKYLDSGAISFNSIKKDFNKIFEAYFKLANELRPALDLFFSVIDNKDLYVQSEFLHLIQAIEIFHRKTNNNFNCLFLKDEEFKGLKEKITNVFEKFNFKEKKAKNQFKDSFFRKLENVNRKSFSLKQRLENIISLLETDLHKSFLKDKKEFINDIQEFRNHLTHHGPRKQDRSGKLKAHTIRLTVILSYLILTEIGIPSKQVSKVLIERWASISCLKNRD